MTWPIDKIVYGSYRYFLRAVGRKLGYGGNYDSWTREQTEIANDVVQRGVRRFYAPTRLDGKKYAHEWGFLRPLRTLTMESGKYAYDLPADFSALDGPITYMPDQSVLYQPIEIVPIHQVNYRRLDTSSTGRPSIAALVAKDIPGFYEIHFWLTPDDDYVVQYPCKLRPLDLSDSNPMPFGGPEHTLTILESCLQEAEIELGLKESVHEDRFLERLGTSISIDQKLNSPQTVGRNIDRSDVAEDPYSYHDLSENTVTYNGVSY